MESLPEYSEGTRLHLVCGMNQAFPFLVCVVLGLLVVAIMIWGTIASTRVVAAIGLLAIVLWASAIGLIEATLQCDTCSRRFMIEGFGRKHPDAHRRTGRNLWASAVLDVIHEQTVVCMYCGKRYRIA